MAHVAEETSRETDRWHRWLLNTRFGGDAAIRERELTRFLYPIRNTVLEKANLRTDDTLLDVGTGDGLIAFGALERLGPEGRVIFSDISADLLGHCRAAATQEGLAGRCDFVLASADSLDAIADRSADVVTTRSVLIYVKDKAAAFAEFLRVLRPGGRVSLFEPINVLMSGRGPDRFAGYDTGPVRDLAAKIIAVYDSYQPPDTDPMTDFDERDLVRLAGEAGFAEVSLELQVSVRNTKPPVPWDRFLAMAGNPKIPSMAEAMDQALTPTENASFTAHLRPLVETGTGEERRALAYLTATKH
jgi:ubiquinone/menaquinone biosynthesis C-methylase UbiE